MREPLGLREQIAEQIEAEVDSRDYGLSSLQVLDPSLPPPAAPANSEDSTSSRSAAGLEMPHFQRRNDVNESTHGVARGTHGRNLRDHGNRVSKKPDEDYGDIRIAFLSPYVGAELPVWFDVFVELAAVNYKLVDWIILCDEVRSIGKRILDKNHPKRLEIFLTSDTELCDGFRSRRARSPA